MVKIKIIAVGKNKDAWISGGSAHYIKLLKRFAGVDITIVPSLKSPASLSPQQIKKREAERLIKHLTGGLSVALSDKGKKMDTIEFSRWLQKAVDTGGGTISFIIGGAYGLDDSILSRANDTISLSPLTFSHQLVRLVLLEQLYRGFSIIHNTDYHK